VLGRELDAHLVPQQVKWCCLRKSPKPIHREFKKSQASSIALASFDFLNLPAARRSVFLLRRNHSSACSAPSRDNSLIDFGSPELFADRSASFRERVGCRTREVLPAPAAAARFGRCHQLQRLLARRNHSLDFRLSHRSPPAVSRYSGSLLFLYIPFLFSPLSRSPPFLDVKPSVKKEDVSPSGARKPELARSTAGVHAAAATALLQSWHRCVEHAVRLGSVTRRPCII
jgi:hypothetical protein